MWSGGSENTVYEWNLNDSETSKLQSSTPNLAKGGKITGLAYCGDMSVLAVGSDDGYVSLLSLSSHRWVEVFRPHRNEISTLTWRRAPIGESKRRLHLSLDTAGHDGACRAFQLCRPKASR